MDLFRYNMGTEVYPFRDMQVVDYGDIPVNPFNIPKVTSLSTAGGTYVEVSQLGVRYALRLSEESPFFAIAVLQRSFVAVDVEELQNRTSSCTVSFDSTLASQVQLLKHHPFVVLGHRLSTRSRRPSATSSPAARASSSSAATTPSPTRPSRWASFSPSPAVV